MIHGVECKATNQKTRVRNFTKKKENRTALQKPIAFSVSFSIFCVQHTRLQQQLTTILTTRGPGPPQFNFCQLIYMCNPGEIKGFYSKSCYLRPWSNLFMNVMQQPGLDLPYGTVPGPCSQMVRLFWSSFIFGEKSLQKSSKYQGYHAV